MQSVRCVLKLAPARIQTQNPHLPQLGAPPDPNLVHPVPRTRLQNWLDVAVRTAHDSHARTPERTPTGPAPHVRPRSLPPSGMATTALHALQCIRPHSDFP